MFRRVHERKGVVFHMGQDVLAFDGGSQVKRVRLKDGTLLSADLVVVGLGITPVTELLRGVERRPDGGLDTNLPLQVADRLYAAGDIAASLLHGRRERIRVEHWRVAQQHGRVAALNMLGHRTAYDAVPYVWTIHYKQRLDYVGHAQTWDEVVIDGDLETPEFLAFYIRGGTVRAVAPTGGATSQWPPPFG